MFDCCKNGKTQPTGEGYLVQKTNGARNFYPDIKDVKESDLHDSHTAILKVNKSDYTALKSGLNGKDRCFVDN